MKKPTRCEAGFTMIEVLVALLVMAFGMLGIVSLLLVSTRANTSSILKQQAVQSAYNVVDKIRANRQAALAGNYTITDIPSSGAPVIPAAPTPDCSTAVCSTAAQLATYDTWYWLAKDVVQLPSGAGSITTAPAPAPLSSNTLITVTVQWDDSPAAVQARLGAAASSPSAGLATIVISTLL